MFDKSATLKPLYTFDGVESHYQQPHSDDETRRYNSTDKPETVTKEM